jgi:hypothetical protein
VLHTSRCLKVAAANYWNKWKSLSELLEKQEADFLKQNE